MFFLVQLAIYIGVTVAAMFLTARPRIPNQLTPTNLRQFALPTNEQGTPVPYVVGTVPIDSPVILWDGDFSAVPIQQDGQTIGYRYFMGMQLALCLGQIDEIVEVRFDGKSLPGAPIAVSPDNDALAMIDRELTVVRIPQAFYSVPRKLADATTAEINTLTGRPDLYYRVVYGHEVVSGYNDRLLYSVKVSGTWRDMDLRIPAAVYGRHISNTPPTFTPEYEIATAVAAAINAAETGLTHHVTVTAEIDDNTHLFALTIDNHADGVVTGFRILGAPSAELINVCLGIHHNDPIELEADFSGGHLATLHGTFETEPGRYLFGGGATGTWFAFSSSWTSCQALFGATGMRDYPGTGAAAERVVSFAQAAASYTRMGERIRADISAPDHFGPSDGVSGAIDVYVGSDIQTADDYLTSPQAIGPPLPDYLGLCYAVVRRFYMGNAGQFRPISFVLRRCPDPLGLGMLVSDLNGDANPASVIYDLLTSPLVSQKPIEADAIETEDFRRAAIALAQEGLGISMVFDSLAPLSEHIDSILKHIDAVRYTDPATGRIRLKLIREDYDVATLPRLDRSNILTCEYGRRSWGDTKNVVKLTYIDRTAGFTRRVVQAIDAANIESQMGNLAIENVTLEGFSSSSRAQWAAERILKTLSYPGAPVSLTANRSAERLRPGDAFVLDWEPIGVANQVHRLAQIGLGTLRNNAIRIESVENVWGAADTVYTAPTSTRWRDPVTAPLPLAAQRLEEAPYALAGGARRRVIALGARGAGDMQGFQGWHDASGGTAYARTNPSAAFTPTGILSGTIGFTSDTLTIRDGLDLGRLQGATEVERGAGRNLCLVDSEWMAWLEVCDNLDGTFSITRLVRGVMDTVPAMHDAGARVWFPSSASPALDEVDRSSDFTAAAKLTPVNRAGVFSLASATRLTLITTSRALKPYAPTAVKLNGVAYPDALVTDPLVISWAHRNRHGSWSFGDAGAAASPEAGTTYTVRIYDESNTLVHEETGLAGTGFTYHGTPQHWRVVVIAVLPGGLESHQLYDYRIGTNHGWGLNWGNDWGGYQAS